MTYNSWENINPCRCRQCGEKITHEGEPYGLCGEECQVKYWARIDKAKCKCCGGGDCPEPFCKTITEHERERDD